VLILDENSVPGFLQCVVVGNVANILYVHAVITKGRSLQVGELLCIYNVVFKRNRQRGGGEWGLP
jgi:hypothetical protein